MGTVKKSLLIILIFVLSLYFVGCNKDTDKEGTQEPVSSSAEISQAITVDNITREQANKLFSTLANRGPNQETGMYNNILKIVPEKELVLFEKTTDETVRKYYYTSYKCETETFILIYNSDTKGYPNDCIGMICFDDIINKNQLQNVKLLKDIYDLETKNSSDALIFFEHLDLLSTFRELALDFDPQWDTHLSLHCTDDGLYILEFESDVFNNDNNLNMDCKVVSKHKYQDGLVSDIYERFIHANIEDS